MTSIQQRYGFCEYKLDKPRAFSVMTGTALQHNDHVFEPYLAYICMITFAISLNRICILSIFIAPNTNIK